MWCGRHDIDNTQLPKLLVENKPCSCSLSFTQLLSCVICIRASSLRHVLTTCMMPTARRGFPRRQAAKATRSRSGHEPNYQGRWMSELWQRWRQLSKGKRKDRRLRLDGSWQQAFLLNSPLRAGFSPASGLIRLQIHPGFTRCLYMHHHKAAVKGRYLQPLPLRPNC